MAAESTPDARPRRARSVRGVWRAAVLVLVAAALSLPASSAPTGPPPRSTASTVSVSGWSAVSSDGWRTSEAVSVDDLVLVGAAPHRSDLEVRGRRDGDWGPWLPLTVDPEHDEDDHADNATSEPAWLGPSDGFQLRASGADPSDVDVTAVTVSDLAYDPSAAPPGTAAADPAVPDVVRRRDWDPNGDCRPRQPAQYTRDVRMAYVHHTVIFPQYAPEQADDVVRAICLYHVEQRGWDDLGYNFLVDQFGRVFEGRDGGIDRPVVGAHASGFNDHAVGISVMGDFEANPVPGHALEAVARVIGWKAAQYGFDPTGWANVRASETVDADFSRFPPGADVSLPAVSGHLDTALNTACPGKHLYEVLPAIRQRARELAATWPEGPREPLVGGMLDDSGSVPPLTPQVFTIPAVTPPSAPGQPPRTAAVVAEMALLVAAGAMAVAWRDRQRM